MKRSSTISLLVVLWLAAAGAASAQQGMVQPAPETPEMELPVLLHQLEERGITLSLGYTAEIFSAVSGGVGRGRRSDYLGSFAPSLTLDFSRIGFGRGQFYMSGQTLHGRGISESRIGTAQALSNLEEQRFSRFIEAWYADSYRNGLLTIKMGRQYADADFGVVENGADFLNSSYGLNPTTPMPTFPAPELGASVWVAPASWFSAGAGVFKGGTLDALTEDGVAMNRRPFAMFEARFEAFGKNAASHGQYSIGLWRQSRGAWLSAGEENAAPVRNYGIYATADHWFMRSPSGEHRGPGLFFQWGWTPADRNEITGYTGGGVAWAGLIPARRRDSIGMGVTRARLVGRDSENIIEWFYKLQVTSKLMVQPDLQWVLNPSGDNRRALVAGLRLGVEF